MTISQASILEGRLKGIDVGKKSRLIEGSGKFKRYQVETVRFKRIKMKKKECNLDIGFKLMSKRAGVSFEEKSSLRVINKYQYRRDMDATNIPLQRVGG